MHQVHGLIERIKARNPIQVSFLDQRLAAMTAADVSDLDLYLTFCQHHGYDLDYVAAAYEQIVTDVLTQEIYFRRNKRYRHSSYAEVADSVYGNPEYMRMYMMGLAVTAFFWPNHAKMREFFQEVLPKDRSGRYLEIGPGHGFYFMTAMRTSHYDEFHGIDISPTSLDLTRSVLESRVFGAFSRFKLRLGDFLGFDLEDRYDALVMGEVLEHVEEPQRFIQAIRRSTHADSFIFLTTCINSPAIDHIYLFESVDHLLSLIAESGLRVVEKLVLPYEGRTLEQAEKQRLSINIALTLQH